MSSAMVAIAMSRATLRVRCASRTRGFAMNRCVAHASAREIARTTMAPRHPTRVWCWLWM